MPQEEDNIMRSQKGARPTGTDGSDFWHRESIAWQYKISTINKSRLKLDMLIHGIMSFFMLIRLLPAIFAFWGIPQPQFMKRWRFPPPRPWEFAWFVSTVAIVFGWKAIPRNVTVLLKQYIIGTVVFGLLPVLYGIIEQFDDLLGYLDNKKLALYFFTYPAVLVWYMFLAIAAQLHMFGIYFSIRLLRAWKASESKPKLR
ncbi:protein jagunal homolog 1-B-like [Liolophura sinensis]|uniref:protein jagunal homolog 1-B-like n=1 Tax=Liolophura sinensis TaxID=3198878 RepID=UPI0031584BBE